MVIYFLRSVILFLTAVKAVVVAKLVILGILPVASLISALREGLVTKYVILGFRLSLHLF